MAPKPGGAPAPATGATIRGKQAAVAEGQLLQFLRSVGYKDSLPPSTVAWLESAPVFRFLASKLSHDNFVTPEEEQEYSELMLARGPDSSLYDAVDGLSCCNSDRLSETMSDHTTTTVGATGAGSTHHHTTATTAGRGGVGSSNSSKEAADDFLTDLPDAEVSRLLEVGRSSRGEKDHTTAASHTCVLTPSSHTPVCVVTHPFHKHPLTHHNRQRRLVQRSLKRRCQPCAPPHAPWRPAHASRQTRRAACSLDSRHKQVL